MFNKVVLLGRLTKVPEVRYTQNGKVVCTFTLAVDDSYGENKTTSFIPIVLWGKTAELCGNRLDKGHRLLVEGRLRIRTYDTQDGSKRWVTEVVGSSVEFIEKKEAGSTESGFEGMGTASDFDEPPF